MASKPTLISGWKLCAPNTSDGRWTRKSVFIQWWMFAVHRVCSNVTVCLWVSVNDWVDLKHEFSGHTYHVTMFQQLGFPFSLKITKQIDCQNYKTFDNLESSVNVHGCVNLMSAAAHPSLSFSVFLSPLCSGLYQHVVWLGFHPM